MQEFKRETVEALKENRLGLFVYFDFEFFPQRVHSGRGTIEWGDNEWTGIGDVLRKDSTSSLFLLSSTHHNRGLMSASLPMTDKTHEVMAQEYYRGRRMEWMMCSLDHHGNVIEQVHQNKGFMVECRVRDDTLTFKAECDLLDSTAEKDARHKSTVEAIRRRFKWRMGDEVRIGGIGWSVNVLLAALGEVLGLVLALVGACLSDGFRRRLVQRWRARKRVYRFRTEPRMPGLELVNGAYEVRADTLEEAKTKLYAKAACVVWAFPRGCVNMLVYMDEHPLEMLNIDDIRKSDDFERWRETDPLSIWVRHNEALTRSVGDEQ